MHPGIPRGMEAEVYARFGSFSTDWRYPRHVSFTPNCGSLSVSKSTSRASLKHRPTHSIISSVRANSDVETMRRVPYRLNRVHPS